MVLPLYEHPAVQAVTGETLRPGGFALTDRSVELCRLQPGARAVDVGCGSGATVRRLCRKYGLSAIGCDPSMALLGQASGGETVVQGRAEALPIVGETMAAVFMECVLSLVPVPSDALKESCRVLAPGGFLILSDLYRRGSTSGGEAGQAAASCAAGARSGRELTRMLRKNGFTVLLWEDHTRLLGELAARIVFAHGSIERFWTSAGAVCPPGSCGGRPGYCLVICKKALPAG